MKYEKITQKADGSLIDILSNMDKIVYRGNNAQEAKDYEKIADENAKLGAEYYCTSNRKLSTHYVIYFIHSIFDLSCLFNKNVF